MRETMRGRPRNAQVDERVLRVAAELIFQCGYTGLSIDDVAERAEVAKTTLTGALYLVRSECSDLQVEGEADRPV